MLEYYFRACFSPYETLFDFEEDYSYNFLKSIGCRPLEGGDWRMVLDNVTFDSVFEEFFQRCEEYERRRGHKNATFGFSYLEDSCYKDWGMSVGAMKDEEHPTVDGFLETFEFLTGIKVDQDRFVFMWRQSQGIRQIDDPELMIQAVDNSVYVGIVPRPGHLHDCPWNSKDIIPMIISYVWMNDSCLPLLYRFRIWTVIWGTGQVIKELIGANPDFMERARALGVGQYVFDDVLNASIPVIPTSEPIPLDLLESTMILRGLLGYMYYNWLIPNEAGYNLKMFRAPHRLANVIHPRHLV
jgi:hypothetical protein